MGRYFRLLASTAAAAVVSSAVVAFTLVVEHTRSGQTYKVNARHAVQFHGFVDDYEKIYGPIRGHLGCYSLWGHVRMSQHHVGNACDFGQLGWGRTVNRPMYRIGWLARKWGLRDGCSFGDCGHIDAGGPGWINGGPAGMVASAEIPGTRQDAPEVGVSHEWPRTLVAKTQTTPQPRVQLASYEPKSVIKHRSEPKPPVHWLLATVSASDILHSPGWEDWTQLADLTLPDQSTVAGGPSPKPRPSFVVAVHRPPVHHLHKGFHDDRLEKRWQEVEREEAEADRARYHHKG